MKDKPFHIKYPLSKKEAMEHMFEYQYSNDRYKGRSFRSFLIRKLGKR